MKTKNITLIIILFAFFISSCNKTEEINIEFTEDEKAWIPYEDGDSIVFINDNLELETLIVTKYIENQKGKCYFPNCPKVIYQPVYGRLTLRSNLFYLNLFLYKNTDNFGGEFNNSDIYIEHNTEIDTLRIDNTLYDSVFVYGNRIGNSMRKFYYKKGVGLIKFEDSENITWQLKNNTK